MNCVYIIALITSDEDDEETNVADAAGLPYNNKYDNNNPAWVGKRCAQNDSPQDAYIRVRTTARVESLP